jgi:TPP-dependent trihydroxycyclohexane-1,2-dione (THcHDO) dehydratase
MFSPRARFIHIDIDPCEIGRNYEALRLVGDAKLALKALHEQLAGRRKFPDAIARTIADARKKYRETLAPLFASEAAPIRPERLMADIQQVLGESFATCIPNQYALVREAIDRGVPIDEVKPGNGVTAQLKKLVLPQVALKAPARAEAGAAKKVKFSWAR